MFVLSDLDGELFTNSQDIEAVCNDLGIDSCAKESITGVVIDGNDTYLSESVRPFDLTAIYYPQEYYLP